MRVLVCGGRNFSDVQLMNEVLTSFDSNPRFGPIDTIIHGDARGADSLAGQWARDNNKTEIPFPANWQLHGKAAGPIRNSEMLLQTRPDFIVAFPGGVGTADMIKKSLKSAKQVYIVDSTGVISTQ